MSDLVGSPKSCFSRTQPGSYCIFQVQPIDVEENLLESNSPSRPSTSRSETNERQNMTENSSNLLTPRTPAVLSTNNLSLHSHEPSRADIMDNSGFSGNNATNMLHVRTGLTPPAPWAGLPANQTISQTHGQQPPLGHHMQQTNSNVTSNNNQEGLGPSHRFQNRVSPSVSPQVGSLFDRVPERPSCVPGQYLSNERPALTPVSN